MTSRSLKAVLKYLWFGLFGIDTILISVYLFQQISYKICKCSHKDCLIILKWFCPINFITKTHITFSSLNESLEIFKNIMKTERKIKYTKFYVSWLKGNMRFLDELEDNCDMHYEDDSVQSGKQNLLVIPADLYDACKSNRNYSQLIDDWGFTRMTKSEIMKYCGSILEENVISNKI